MQIKALHLKNFRCFSDLSVNFSVPYTVLIGNNGAGKTSILQALQILLDTFVTPIQFNMVDSVFNMNLNTPEMRITTSDVKLKAKLNGSVFYNEPQYPSSLKLFAEISDDSIEWETVFGSESSMNPAENPILNVVLELQKKLVSNESVVLPVVVFYNSKRLWSRKISLNNEDEEKESPFLSRLKGYVGCIDDSVLRNNDLREWFMRMFLIERKRQIPEFQAVKQAITNCYLEIDNRENLKKVLIDYDAEKEDDLEFHIYFNDGNVEILPMSYLSDGSQSILAMVADIAYRMAILNPHLLDNVTQETNGVILIDEIDLHLHPSWQRRIIDALHKTFPKVQFIFTTHSPSILTNVPKENILILDKDKVFTPSVKTYGRDVNSILREVMHSEIRPKETSDKLSAFSNAIADENLIEAEKILGELKVQLGENDSEVVGAQVTLDLEKL